jgi:hypothetical protein
VAAVPGAAPAEWLRLRELADRTLFHAVTLPLELHRKETDGYRYSLSGEPPRLFVVMRRTGCADFPWRPFLVTASAWEAQGYQEFGDDLVEAVPMPDAVIAWVQEFVTRHHVDEPFFKRRRKGRDAGMDGGSEFVRLDAAAEDG